MSSDERDIFHFLKSWGTAFIGAKEIARRVGGKKRFHEDPQWAQPPLINMVDHGILESDAQGRYRIKRDLRKKKEPWVAPDIEKILAEEDSPASAETGADEKIAGDEHYEQL
jgi:hypothetical protein